MKATNHARARMAQRGINKRMIDLTLRLGEVDGDRYVLHPKAIRDSIEAMKREQKDLEHALRKGGVTVVATEETLVTVFRTTSFKRGT